MERTYNILQEVEKAGITDPFYQLMVALQNEQPRDTIMENFCQQQQQKRTSSAISEHTNMNIVGITAMS